MPARRGAIRETLLISSTVNLNGKPCSRAMILLALLEELGQQYELCTYVPLFFRPEY
jgi:hypothetical protein